MRFFSLERSNGWMDGLRFAVENGGAFVPPAGSGHLFLTVAGVQRQEHSQASSEKEFEEIVLDEKLIGQNEDVDAANVALVKHFNSIKDSRLNIYQTVLAKRKISNDKFVTLIKGYVRLLNQAQELMETVENLNGSPAVMPAHFRDLNFKV